MQQASALSENLGFRLARAIRAGWQRGQYARGIEQEAQRRAQIYSQIELPGEQQREACNPEPTEYERAFYTQEIAVQILAKHPILKHLTISATPEDIRERAKHITDIILTINKHTPIDTLEKAQSIAVNYGASGDITPTKIKKERWWRRQIRRAIRSAREEAWQTLAPLNMIAGCSPDMQTEGAWQDELTNKWLENTTATCNNVTVTLPTVEEQRAQRYAEMLCWTAETSNYLNETHASLFVTATLPESWHPTTTKNGARKTNDSWNGKTPAQGHRELNKQWQRIRALFKKRGIDYTFFRAAEPHKDGTPHWHLMLWVERERSTEATEILFKYFLRAGLEKDEEPSEARLKHGIEIKTLKNGNAAGYLLKYIAKQTKSNIVDINTKKIDADPVNWRRAHNIRSYATTARKATLWRLARQPWVKETFEDLHNAAKSGDYIEFLEISDNYMFEKIEWQDEWGSKYSKIAGIIDLNTGEVAVKPEWTLETLPIDEKVTVIDRNQVFGSDSVEKPPTDPPTASKMAA